MTCDLLNRKDVCASLAEPSQKRVAQRVYHAVFRKPQTFSQLLILPKFLVYMIERSDEIWLASMICENIFRLPFERAVDKRFLVTGPSGLHVGGRSSIYLHERKDNRASSGPDRFVKEKLSNS
jgi:hypothetical protein